MSPQISRQYPKTNQARYPVATSRWESSRSWSKMWRGEEWMCGLNLRLHSGLEQVRQIPCTLEEEMICLWMSCRGCPVNDCSRADGMMIYRQIITKVGLCEFLTFYCRYFTSVVSAKLLFILVLFAVCRTLWSSF